MTGPEPLVPATLRPFDLQAPASVLFGPAHNRPAAEHVLHLGGEGDERRPEVRVYTWQKCRQPCPVKSPMANHDAGARVDIEVPCDALPHCHYCECGSGHQVILTSQQAAELKAILP